MVKHNLPQSTNISGHDVVLYTGEVCPTYKKLPNGTYKYVKGDQNKSFILLSKRKFATIRGGTPDLSLQAAGADFVLLSRFVDSYRLVDKDKYAGVEIAGQTYNNTTSIQQWGDDETLLKEVLLKQEGKDIFDVRGDLCSRIKL